MRAASLTIVRCENARVAKYVSRATLLSAAFLITACNPSAAPTTDSCLLIISQTFESPTQLDTTSFDLALPREQIFDRFINGKPAAPLTRQQQPTTRHNAEIETIDSIDDDPLRTLYWSRRGGNVDGGEYVLHATIEHDDKALTIFDPPLLLLPATLQRGVPVTMKSSMRVLRADDPRRQREQGTATQSITFLGRSEIQTPQETVEALVFQIEFHADLRFADIHETTLLYRDPPTGTVIAEHTRQRISILGLPPSDEETILIRTPG